MDFIEQVLGMLLMLFVLADVFLTVLYARSETGLFAPRFGRLIWRVFRAVSVRRGSRNSTLMSLCGPIILISVVALWAIGLAVGAALIIHPELGTGVQTSSGSTPTDFVSALEAGGSSLSIVGAADYAPTTAIMKLLYLFNSLVGVVVLSLTLTYLMQVYTALRSRNTLALNFHFLSRETDDAIELVAGLGPRGQFSGGYNHLNQLAMELTAAKEAEHFYPALAYFRFPEPYYSASLIATQALDVVALIRTALNEDAAWLKESAAVEHLSRAALQFMTNLEPQFGWRHAEGAKPDAEEVNRWRARFETAVVRLRAAGLPVIADVGAGANTYVQMRTQWTRRVDFLASAMGYDRRDIDAATRIDVYSH